ncbi:ATP-binding protein [Aestuariibius sp. 2305UL40-4]|uniref:sensor histidine kinase n=1 Tax=Aestuariibius violaceus TaxID=3234132 RepID=UPI00345E40F9
MAKTPAKPRDRGIWSLRIAFGVLIVLLVATVWITNILLTQRFTETTQQRAEVRLTQNAGRLMAELRAAANVPVLLAQNPTIAGALNSGDHTQSSQRLAELVEEADASSARLLDAEGRTVAALDRSRLGENNRLAAHFVEAMRSQMTVFTLEERDTPGYTFSYSRRVEFAGEVVGVVVVEVDLARLERVWAGTSDAVLVMDSTGRIILATEGRWRGFTMEDALDRESPLSAIEQAISATQDWRSVPAEAYLRGRAVMYSETRVPFRGWRMASFTTYAGVRERVNAVLALEITGFAILLALLFGVSNRKTASRLVLFQRESAKLRQLNRRLQQEIAERQKVEKDLQTAEQTVAQTSKLAALGEMSAAVSHELNQPLAAMKTYLAGARLLLQRKRPEEALSSFQRIDDLIERMGAITRQLKSYARKGGEAFEPIDMRDAVSSALAMMEPQLRAREVKITTTLPEEPVMIYGDRLRLEQVLINLLRNALDATKGREDAEIGLLLAQGETAILSVRDNGAGIDDLDSLFEPFYTTKQPGDGVGLGLAISSGIVSDLGGQLTARNGPDGGAVFEVRLPIVEAGAQAAE